ncbi:MAG: isoprenylcysteine carboxylmethyltransferase family protein [Terriglobales bacterium]|jgi:protein-S-isoprenylcysteine O-methyltransferase Ste14
MEASQRRAFAVLQILAAGVVLWVLATWNRSPWNVQRCLGTVLTVAGLSLVGVARYQLGRSFSVTAEAHQLVTHGLYSKIRNPIYVFGGVMLAGLVLVMQMPVLWIALVVMAIGQTIRARREARVLEAAFGDAYREYRRKTWF